MLTAPTASIAANPNRFTVVAATDRLISMRHSWLLNRSGAFYGAPSASTRLELHQIVPITALTKPHHNWPSPPLAL
jgi:hypothetical protein